MSDFTSSSPFSVSDSSGMIRCLYNGVHDRDMKKAIAVIYIVTSLLSILGAGSVIFYAIIKRIVRSPEVHPLFHLALADLMLASVWFSGACIWFHEKEGSCFYLDVVGEVAHLATFFLTVNYGLNAYIRLREKVKNISNFQSSSVSSSTSYIWLSRVFYAICWFAPVVIMAPLPFHFKYVPNSKDCTHCLLLFDRPKTKSDLMNSTSGIVWESYGSIALVTTLSFSILALTLIYFLMVRDYRKAVVYSGVLTDLQRDNIDTMRNKIFLYILVFLICWSPAMVVALCDIDPKIKLTSMRHWNALFVMLGLTAPMQGFLNCIVYGWSRKSFRDASEQRRSKFLDSDEYVFQRRRTSYGSMKRPIQ